jgi:hypothetical protein
VRERISSGSERSYRGLEGRRGEPGFSQTEKIDLVVMYEGLQKFRFVILRSDGRSGTDVEIGKDEVVSRNRARVNFDVASQKEQENEELAGEPVGDLKLTGIHD